MPTQERAIFLFDGPNFYKNLKQCHLNKGHLSYSKLASNLAGQRHIQSIIFFTSPTDSKADPQNYVSQQRFFAALKNDNVTLKLGKLVKRNEICSNCRHIHDFKVEKSVDVQIAMSLVLGAINDEWDTVYLASCDSDLIPAIDYVKSTGRNIFLLLPSGSKCYGVGRACTSTIPIRQNDIDLAQAH